MTIFRDRKMYMNGWKAQWAALVGLTIFPATFDADVVSLLWSPFVPTLCTNDI